VVRVPGILTELSQRRVARILSAALLALGCAASAPPRTTLQDGRPLMGTVLQLTLVHANPSQARDAAEACFALGAALEAALTTYDASSATSRMNAQAGGGPFAAPPALARILADSQRLARETRGAFDPSVGPLIELWGAAARAGRLPTGREIAAARSRVGIGRISFADDGRVVLAPGMAVNFGGIGKGWALDRMGELLAERGVEDALLDFGGSSWLARGAPADAPAWRVLLRDGRGGYAGAIRLRDTSASFSESFGQWSEIEGRRFGHVIDPRTGWPIQQALAGVALARGGATAEALTKALIVLGPGEGLAVVAQTAGAEALVIDAEGARHESPGFRRATDFVPLDGTGAAP
jgi:FAD:protein FMN transferase